MSDLGDFAVEVFEFFGRNDYARYTEFIDFAYETKKLWQDSDLPYEFKQAATLILFLQTFDGNPFGASATPIIEGAYQLVYNTPDQYGGFPKEVLWSKLNELDSDNFPLNPDGTLSQVDLSSLTNPSPASNFPPTIPIERSSNDDLENPTQLFDDAANQGSPLVLDIDGDGIELAAVDQVGSVYWDGDLDGMAEATGWIGGGDGLLAIDLNSDGIINNSSELFGDQTGSANGFLALAAYDTNSDGFITDSDLQFDDLLVWIDTDSDGYSDTEEQHTLADLGITSINLGYTDVSYFINGNEIKQESSFTINGQTHDIVDAYFTYDDVNTVYDQGFSIDIDVLNLPNLRGYGNLPDLYISMSLDTTLKTLLQTIEDADAALILDQTFDLETKIEEIMFRWAEVDQVDPASRGSNIDARYLEFLEELVGEEWINSGGDPNPGTGQADTLEEAFHNAKSLITLGILAQTEVNWMFGEDVQYDSFSGEIISTNQYDSVIFIPTSEPSINGSQENDVYLYYLNSGNKTFYDTSGTDIIQFGTGIAVGDLRFIGDGLGDFKIQIAGGDVIKIDNQFVASDPDRQIETAIMADGTIVDLVNNLTFTGTSAAEDVTARSDNNTLVGLEGNDKLYGLGGDDIYIYNLGDGNDIFYDTSGTDIIQFGTGIAVGDLRFIGDGLGDFKIQIAGGDVIKIDNQFVASDPDRQIETAIMADGTIVDLVNNLTYTGTSAAEDVTARSDNNTLVGLEGNDKLYGLGGDDVYIYNLGDGNDIFYDTSGTDIIQFGTGITAGDIRFIGNGLGDLSIQIAGGDIIKIDNQFVASDPDRQIETAIMADGTIVDLVNNLTFTGTASGENIDGRSDDNTLIGLGGNDNLRGYGGHDTAVFSGNYADYTLTQNTSSISVNDNVGSDGNDIVFDDVEILKFADGTYDYQTQTFTPFPPSGPLTPIHIEAESMTLLGDYTVANNSAASGGQNVEIAVLDGTGTIQTTFDGGSGTYNLTIGYFDEMDAAPTYELYVNGNLMDSWVADGTFGSFYANAQTLTSHTINDLNLNTGDIVALTSTRLAGEQNEVDDFYFDPVDQPLPDPVFIEAEDMTLIGDYTVANNSSASNGQNVEIAVADGTGTIQTNFSGDTGTYDLTIAYYDEMDAAPTYELYVNGNLMDSWVADGTFGSFYANAQTLTSHTINGLTLNPGDVVALTSTRLAGEQNEVDSFHFIPQGAQAPVDPSPLYYEAEDLDLDVYQNGPNSASSDGYAAWLFGSSGTTGTISTEFEGIDGLYDLSISYFDEDGTSASLELRVNGNAVESWLADEATGSTAADTQSLTQYTIEDLNLAEGDVVEFWAEKPALSDLIYVDTFTFMPGDVDNIAGTHNGQTLSGTTGNEALYGLGGDDTLFADSGDDLLYGGHGTDTLWGEAGADTFIFEETSAFANVDTIADFDTNEGDAIDISGLLEGYDETQSAIDDFVFLSEANGDTTIAIDRDGTGTTYTAQDIAIIDNVTGLDADTLLTNGNLIVV